MYEPTNAEALKFQPLIMQMQQKGQFIEKQRDTVLQILVTLLHSIQCKLKNTLRKCYNTCDNVFEFFYDAEAEEEEEGSSSSSDDSDEDSDDETDGDSDDDNSAESQSVAY